MSLALCWCLYCKILTYFRHFSDAPTVKFKEVNVCWVPLKPENVFTMWNVETKMDIGFIFLYFLKL